MNSTPNLKKYNLISQNIEFHFNSIITDLNPSWEHLDEHLKSYIHQTSHQFHTVLPHHRVFFIQVPFNHLSYIIIVIHLLDRTHWSHPTYATAHVLVHFDSLHNLSSNGSYPTYQSTSHIHGRLVNLDPRDLYTHDTQPTKKNTP